MMGRQDGDQASLLYELCLEDRVQADHLLRGIDRFLALSASLKRQLRRLIAIGYRRSSRRLQGWLQGFQSLTTRPLRPNPAFPFAEISLDSKNGNLGGGDFRRPQDFGQTCRGSDALRLARQIGDDSAADRAADFLTPQFPPIIGVERIKIAAHVAEKTTPPAVGVMPLWIG